MRIAWQLTFGGSQGAARAACLAALCAFAGAPHRCLAETPPSDDAFVARVRADVNWLAHPASRVAGSPGHDHTLAELIDKVRQAGPDAVWTQSFPVVVPRVERAELTIADAAGRRTRRVYPLWPAGVRPNSTPAGGIAGRLVYVGRAGPAELRPASLAGQIAVMEMTGEGRWQDAYSAGAEAVVLLGSPPVQDFHARAHLTEVPINVPRFYVPDGPLAAELRDGRARQGRLVARCTWVEVSATNVWALVRPRGGSPSRQAVMVAAPLDAMSVVPELAPGADAAVDAAMVLGLLRGFAASRPARPAVFAFVDAFAVNERGMRELLMTLATTDREVRDYLRDDERLRDGYAAHEALAARLEAAGAGPGALAERRCAALRGYVKDEVSREVIAIETEMHPLRLRAYSLEGRRTGALRSGDARRAEQLRTEAETLRRRVEAMAARRADIFAAQQHLLERAEVSPATAALAGRLWQRARLRVARQLEEARDEVALYAERRRLRQELLAELGLTGRGERPLEFILGLDLSDSGVAAGFLPACSFLVKKDATAGIDFVRWLTAIRKGEADALWPAGPLRAAVNLQTLGSTEALFSHSAGDVAQTAGLAETFGTAGATWATLDCPRRRTDTPQDRPERLDWSRLAPQAAATRRLVRRLLDGSDFTVSHPPSPRWNRVDGCIVDRSVGEPVPNLPLPGYLTAMVAGRASGGRATIKPLPVVPGIRRVELRLTGADGRFRFDGLYVNADRQYTPHFVQSYLLDDDGAIIRALDLRKAGRSVRLNVDIRSTDLRPLRGVAFSCGEVCAVRLFDPRFLQNLAMGTMLDARRGGEPQRMNFTLYGGQLACQLEPDVLWQAVLRSGIARNRMVLANVAPGGGAGGEELREALRGFAVGQRPPRSPAHESAVEFHRIDRRRLDEYAGAGIRSRPLEALQRHTERMLADTERAIAADDGAGAARQADGALANEVRVYQSVRDLADDVVRGAIFLLLVTVPFAFAMDRLLFASPRIYRQIAAMLGVFAAMAGVLWSFHPAFRISSQPLMIVMAFAILGMSALVLAMVYGKFESSLAEVRSGRAETSAAQTSRLGVLVTAVRLGIANMRKRKLRTALTACAVVLITFCLLCFMSTSSYSGQRQRELSGAAAPYTGVLVRQPSRRPMPPESLDRLMNLLGAERAVGVRVWWANAMETNWRLHVRVRDTGRQVSLKAALGLSAAEAELTGIDRLCPDWRRFAAGGGCYLAPSTAEELGLKAPGSPLPPGRSVVIAGRELEVIGCFDPAGLERLRDLDGQPLLPTDYDALSAEQRHDAERTNLSELAAELDSAGGLAQEPELPAVGAGAAVIVHEEFLRGLRDARLRSVAAAAATGDQAERLAGELTGRLAFPIYYGSPAGVKVVASTPMLPGAAKGLLIPLLIGGLMICNTMLSSIAERRREVYIYTSLGLAPLHVAVLFLAEAATYGLMGSVFGYVVGQGAATGLSDLGWMGGLTLNYSGTQAVAVMLMVLAVVVVSSLVPAYLAGRLAAPSSERTWRVPQPVGETIRDELPFTVTPRTANGVLLFLQEYLDAHREGAIGHFSTDELRVSRRREGGLDSIALDATVWLAPYDLGVRQEVRLTVRPTGLADVFGIDVQMVRRSGQRRTWRSLNRKFLGDLRRQLLGWRRLRPQRVLAYIAEGRKMLATVAEK